MSDEHEESAELLSIPAALAGQPVEAQVEQTPEERRFAEERRTTLGGTDQAAHLGFSSYRNAWDVAAEKRGLIPPWEGNERTRWGTILEDPVAREYAKRTGVRLRQVKEVVRDKIHPFLGGHPDRFILGKKKGLEVKTVEYGRDKWSEPGEPLRVPREHYVQCQHYMLITGFEEWDLAALFGLSKLRWYTIERNEVVIRALREKGCEFWERYVVGSDLPPIEGRRAKAWLRERYPAPTGPTYVVANVEQIEAITKWREAKKHREQWEKEEDRFKVHIQNAIGDAEGIVSGDATITWKKDKDSTALVTDYEELLRFYAEKHDFQIDAEDIVKFTRTLTTREGARKLRVKEKK